MRWDESEPNKLAGLMMMSESRSDAVDEARSTGCKGEKRGERDERKARESSKE